MSKQEFIFEYKNKINWPGQKRAVGTALQVQMDTATNDLAIIIDDYKPTRSSKSLKAYWVLIGIVTKWMNDKGHYFTKDEVSDYFKLQVGHKIKVNNLILREASVGGKENLYTYIPKSISDSSQCKFEDMKKLIDFIIEFGARNNIPGCEIRDNDLEYIKEFYEKSNK
jgi:hypothetical protein